MRMSDALSFQQQQRINDELVIYGYVRNVEKTLSTNIPMEIIHLCFNFYHVPRDRFDPELHAKNITISGNRALCHGSEGTSFDADDFEVSNAFLSNILSQGKHRWLFKWIKHHNLLVYVGIWNESVETANADHLREILFNSDDETEGKDKKPKYYGLNLTYGELRGGDDTIDFTDKFVYVMQKDDIVDMYLDLEENEIKLSIKSKIEDTYPAKRAFSITPGDSYRAVVTLEEGTDITGIELLSYQEL